MVEVLKTISISVITNSAVLGLFVWVFKKLFESSLNKRTELFKREIELINQKNFYQFSKLYDEQAQTVKNVYAELVHMSDQVGYLVFHYNLLENHPELFEQYRIPKDGNSVKWDRYLKATLSEKKEDVKAQELFGQISRALSEFRKSRIYFSKEIADEIERLMNLVLFIASEFKNVTYRDPEKFEPVVAEEVIETWSNAVQVIQELFPVLEESFRKHIGMVESHNKPNSADTKNRCG